MDIVFILEGHCHMEHEAPRSQNRKRWECVLGRDKYFLLKIHDKLTCFGVKTFWQNDIQILQLNAFDEVIDNYSSLRCEWLYLIFF